MTWISDAAVAHLRQVADWPDLGSTKYELVEKIGQGGMASVYLAIDRDLQRQVAVKVISPSITDDSAKARMAREAHIIARLEHPGIIPVHDIGTLTDGRVYYVMKFVRGKRLDEHWSSSMPLADVLLIFVNICQAVAFAHAHGVIHRDLKPQNIMIGGFGEVLVMDWGVAKSNQNATLADSSPSTASGINGIQAAPETLHGTVLGTPGYMAPEQARGEVALIDPRTDVYALGAILFFLTTGTHPAPIRPSTSKAEADCSLPPSPRRLNPSLRRPIEAICLKALAPKPAERYASVQDLADDVSRFLQGRRVGAYPERYVEAAIRLASKYRVALGLIAAYLLMRVLLIFFWRH